MRSKDGTAIEAALQLGYDLDDGQRSPIWHEAQTALDRLAPRNADEDAPRADGTQRKAHYGAGEQPWDLMVRLGWAPYFAASCVVRYLRREKEPEHSTESARWYWARLLDFSNGKGLETTKNDHDFWLRRNSEKCIGALMKELAPAELARIAPPT